MFEKIGVPEKIDVVKSESIDQDVYCPKCNFKFNAIKRKDNLLSLSGNYILLGKINAVCPNCRAEILI